MIRSVNHLGMDLIRRIGFRLDQGRPLPMMGRGAKPREREIVVADCGSHSVERYVETRTGSGVVEISCPVISLQG